MRRVLAPRRLAIVLLIIVLVIIGKSDSSFAQSASGDLPNIVLLYADDMGWGDLGVQNPESKIPTPHLDALARSGTRFTDAHSSSGICTPSRYAMLHGRYHWRKFHGIVNSFDQPVMDDERTTMAELLKSAGYQTACIGKWHLGWDWASIKKDGAQPAQGVYSADDFDWNKSIYGGPLSHGFDVYFGDDVPNFPPYAWFENDRVITPQNGMLNTTAKTAEGSWEARPGPAVEGWDFWDVMPQLTQRAVHWIESQKKNKPFFLYFPFTSPHAPIVPTEAFHGRSGANGYGDFMVQTDDTVGRVMKAIKDKGFAENTLVIFTADNGPERYAYDRVKNHEHRSMGPLRGLKRDLWEGGHRVPFLVCWPGKIPAGRVSEGVISQIDLLATIAAMINQPLPADSGEDSINQLDFVLGKSGSQRDVLVHNTNPNGYAIRKGDWVLIASKTGAISKVPEWFDRENGYQPHKHEGELYDLKQDLGQRKNLYLSQPEKVKELALLLKQTIAPNTTVNSAE